MIEPKKSPGFQRILANYLTYQLKKHFYRVWIDIRGRHGNHRLDT
ncbi:MAG: hypothetical protein ACQEWI_17150 [Bacillota bacterium]